jgi:hypothetical protein
MEQSVKKKMTHPYEVLRYAGNHYVNYNIMFSSRLTNRD